MKQEYRFQSRRGLIGRRHVNRRYFKDLFISIATGKGKFCKVNLRALR
jgi:hypothetical protein